MKETQPEFFVADPESTGVVWLEKLLRGNEGWMTARDLMRTDGCRYHDRDIRALASASSKIISGQKGYKHVEHATPEEVSHAASWLESQAKKMSDRAGAIRRNAHRRIG